MDLEDADYTLTDKQAWFDVKGKKVSVRLRFLKDCVEVAMYHKGRETDPEIEISHLPYPHHEPKRKRLPK